MNAEEIKMKRNEEKKYYAWLEYMIQKRFSTMPLKTEEEKEIEIMMIVHQIQKKYPTLAERLIAGTIDTTHIKSQDKQDILKFLAATEKGTAVIWKDSADTEYLFINAGDGAEKNKKRIVILSDKNITNDNLKSILCTKLLMKDVEHIYHRIYEKENKKHHAKMMKSLFSPQNTLINSASSFERNFKKMVQKQGYGCSALNTASIMIRTMSASEKKKLNQAFAAMGVKNAEELQTVLETWKGQALNQRYARPKISMHNEMGIGM